ncbi:hypothetical protein EUTSA_v10021398mg [Eutrema salsugineum]|uniref:Peptidase C1A papain C-terminal domain-containing protein n=1 Tax=Eutrema salsugineum TaxID=72664 RepID=V4LCG0_EUTSA|nr:uncharacterized protein LOC18024574 [Eutrema salsugineum]ESQ48110.1 hypothetical protein EUTSA_v10021398mg [Eutrema salsugineum]
MTRDGNFFPLRKRYVRKEIILLNWKNSVFRVIEKVIYQKKSICWAIAMIRQLSAMYKIRGDLDITSALSIQELLLYVPKVYLSSELALDDLMHAEYSLKEFGTVEEKLSPLTYILDSMKLFDQDVFRFKIESMRVCRPSEFRSCNEFEQAVVEALAKSPVACVVKTYASYNRIRGKQVYRRKPRETKYTLHVMVLVNHGINGKGQRFFEFQDSYGKKWGRKGFVRVAKGVGLVGGFIVFELPPRARI